MSRAPHEGADHRIVDPCAGSGGPLPFIQRRLHKEGVHIHVTLTDLVPSTRKLQTVRDENKRLLPDECCDVDYVSEPVATDCQVPGTRTIFGAIQHVPPGLARRMPQNAVDTRSSIVVMDTKRSYLHVLVFRFLTTLAVLLSAPFRRNPLPRCPLRLALTYCGRCSTAWPARSRSAGASASNPASPQPSTSSGCPNDQHRLISASDQRRPWAATILSTARSSA